MLNNQKAIKKYSLLIVVIFGVLAIAIVSYFFYSINHKEKTNQIKVNVTKEQHLKGGGFKSPGEKRSHFLTNKSEKNSLPSKGTVQEKSGSNQIERIRKNIINIIEMGGIKKAYINKP